MVDLASFPDQVTKSILEYYDSVRVLCFSVGTVHGAKHWKDFLIVCVSAGVTDIKKYSWKEIGAICIAIAGKKIQIDNFIFLIGIVLLHRQVLTSLNRVLARK